MLDRQLFVDATFTWRLKINIYIYMYIFNASQFSKHGLKGPLQHSQVNAWKWLTGGGVGNPEGDSHHRETDHIFYTFYESGFINDQRMHMVCRRVLNCIIGPTAYQALLWVFWYLLSEDCFHGGFKEVKCSEENGFKGRKVQANRWT